MMGRTCGIIAACVFLVVSASALASEAVPAKVRLLVLGERLAVAPFHADLPAVGAIEERAVVRGGALEARPVLEMTLTCDHRTVDGATASEFLRTVKQFLEEPGLAL